VARLGVVLDSGGVLIRPAGGRPWFPPAAFDEVLVERGLDYEPAALAEALAVGDAYLDDVHPIPLADEEAELAVWTRYFELLLEGIGITHDHHGLARSMVTAWEAAPGVEPYPWTLPVLAELEHRGIPVVVLSDAWPSLRRWYRELGLDTYVRAMVISGEEGITKPDRRVFDKAVALVSCAASNVTFVDDYPGHVQAAVDLGMRGLRLRHADHDPADGIQEITDLTELLTRL
jgi:HAD superfamily hydrolase (TIGR01509 family)